MKKTKIFKRNGFIWIDNQAICLNQDNSLDAKEQLRRYHTDLKSYIERLQGHVEKIENALK